MTIQVIKCFSQASAGGGGDGITYVGYTEDTWASANSQRVISLSGLGLQENDLVVAMLAISFPEAVDDLQPVTSGYTQQVERHDDTNRVAFGVFTKKMGSSPDANITIQATSASGGNDKWWIVKISAWRGVDTTTPMDVAAVSNGASGSGSATSPAITPVTAGAVAVDMAFSNAGNVLNVIGHGNPGSYDNFEETLFGKSVTSMGSKEWSGSGAMGPWAHGGAAGSITSWSAAQIALRPA